MVVDPKATTLIRALSAIIDVSMGEDLQAALGALQSWRGTWLDTKPADPTRFEVRLSSRIGNVSATFLDAEGEAGQMLVRPIIYRTPPKQRPCFFMSRRNAPDAFGTYFRVFDEEWNHARRL
jgi:hypothetical protein